MTAGARAQPVVYDTTQKKVYIGDMNDHQPLSWPEYQEGVDSSIVCANVDPLTGMIEKTASGDVIDRELIGVSGMQREIGFSLPGQNTGTGLTVVSQRPALAPFYGVRLHYANYHTAAYDITAAKVAASPTHQNDGTALTWVSVLFGGAAGGQVPAGSGSTQNAIPKFLSSDAVYLASVDRTDDATKYRLLQSRTYSSGLQNVLLMDTDLKTYNDADGKRQYAGRSPAGDLVSTITASQPLETGTSQRFIHPAIVEYFYSVPSRSVLFAGDSLTQGQGSTYNNLGFPIRACDARTNDSFVTQCLNFGVSGQGYAATIETAKNAITALKPDVCHVFAWSPNNNPSSDAVMLECRQRLMDLAKHAFRNGVRLAVGTSGPVNAYAAASDARIKAQNAWVTQMGAAGAWDVVDYASVLEDPADRSNILPAYDSGDGLHYSNAGYAAMAALAKSVI